LGLHKSWFLLLLPFSFLVVALSKLQIIKNINPILLKFIELTPVILILFSFLKLINASGLRLEYLSDINIKFLKIFKIGFPLTLLASIVIIFSPISNQKAIPNEGIKKDDIKKTDYQKTLKLLEKNLIEIVKNTTRITRNITIWLRNNPKYLYLCGILLVISVAFWLIFIKDYPKRDAKELALELCECYSNYQKETKSAYRNFLDDFDNQNYNARKDARAKLNSIKNPISSKRKECLELINKKNKELKNEYDYSDKRKFEIVFKEIENNCSNSNNFENSTLYSDIQKKIETIQDPEPDENKIKEDLIGNKIPGWNFNYLSEFKEMKILDTSKGNNRIEYKVYFKLKKNSSKYENECEVITIYKRGYNGWYFDKVNMNYITYINTFYPDKWTKVTPLKNCNWNAENKYKMSWKTSNWSYARKTTTGPSLGAKTLPYSKTYYIKSLEKEEIKVKFTYRPKK